VTDIIVDEHNVRELVKGGRARWKIENETFNTLKNQGYHIEHNYGHGQRHLSMNFFVLNLLAFYMHQIFELTDCTNAVVVRLAPVKSIFLYCATCSKWYCFETGSICSTASMRRLTHTRRCCSAQNSLQ
jgi:hypothetical protein